MACSERDCKGRESLEGHTSWPYTLSGVRQVLMKMIMMMMMILIMTIMSTMVRVMMTRNSLMAPLRTFAPIVSAHPYCARNSLRDVMPRHALSARAVEEMWRYIALVGTLIFMHGFNSLK